MTVRAFVLETARGRTVAEQILETSPAWRARGLSFLAAMLCQPINPVVGAWADLPGGRRELLVLGEG